MPAYNEAENLPALLTQLLPQLAALTDRFEVVIVDDGSTDATAAAIAPWVQRGGVRYLRLSRNFGKEHALTAGIDHARGEVVVLMDADLQHPVEIVAKMLDAWQQGADMVCAARASRADESCSSTRLLAWLSSALALSAADRPSAIFFARSSSAAVIGGQTNFIVNQTRIAKTIIWMISVALMLNSCLA